jgi:hypothetical protein
MGIEVGIFAKIAAGLSVASTVKGISDRQEANYNSRLAADEQRKVQGEQKAQNASKAMAEKRQQVREERIKRARVIQGSVNSGSTGSSGELGAVSSLATTLGSNVGANAGALASADRTSGYLQNSADFTGNSNQNLADANFADQLNGFSKSIFQEAGGFAALKF